MSDLVAIWTRQYIRPKDIGDRIHMTDDRLTKIINDSYNAGIKDGMHKDRAKMAEALHASNIDLQNFSWPSL